MQEDFEQNIDPPSDDDGHEAISEDSLARAFARMSGMDADMAFESDEAPHADDEWLEADDGDASEDGEEPTILPIRSEQGDEVSEERIDAVLDAADRLEAASRRASDLGYARDTASRLVPDEEDDGPPANPKTILEAMLFVGAAENDPISAEHAADLMRGVTPDEIADHVRELNEQYETDGCPYQVKQESEGYRLVLRSEFDDVRNRFYGRVREAKLSPAAIEALAIVAYRQPITGEEVNRIRSAPSGHLLSQLVRRMLLRIDREEQQDARHPHYRTTDRFLELFGLRSLDDLPMLEELE